MNVADAEVVRQKGNVRLLKIDCRSGNVSYCVLGEGSAKHFDDYEDALEEFNLRWLRVQYGD